MKRPGFLIFALAALVLVPLGPARAEASPRAPFHLGHSSRAYALTAGPGDAMWFVAESSGGNRMILGKVTEAGQVTEEPLKVGRPAIPTILSSPQGDIWFGEEHAIGRRTPDGELKTYPLPVGSGSPSALALGPEGDVWFTDSEASRVGHLTSTGQVVQFRLARGRRPNGIAAGADGNLWVTEPIKGTIDKITPSGTITEFGEGELYPHLDSIVAGPDGNLWFASERAPFVGMITPDGVVTEFSVPTSAGTRGIVAGPGGLLYFLSGAEVGAIAPDGTVSWPACPVGCHVGTTALAPGPDGRLWIASGQIDCEGFCGGTRAFDLEHQAGTVKPYSLPPLTIGIGPHLRHLYGDRTKVLIACGLRAGCSGTVRLGLYMDPDHGSRFRTLAEAPFDLGQGETRRVVLRFADAFAARLEREGSTHLLARAEGSTGIVALRGFDLKG